MEFAERTLRADNISLKMPRDPHGWYCREGLALHEVEAFLDELEIAGVDEREMSIEPAGTFRVRWRG